LNHASNAWFSLYKKATCRNKSLFLSIGYEIDIFDNFAYEFELSQYNEILADARMKSANADEIFGFASDEIKSTHRRSDFIRAKREFHIA